MNNVIRRVQKKTINTLLLATSLSANAYRRNGGCTDSPFNRLSIFFVFALGILIMPSYGFASEISEKHADEVEDMNDPFDSSEKQEGDVQDMSDPLAVYTQVGLGATNKGINIKVGQSYDTGNDETMGMNVLEIKGVLGESLGWDGSGQRDDSINSFRLRNFSLDLTNGRGAQIDMVYELDKTPIAAESASISYSLLQALPKLGRFNFYPLAGVGVAVGKDALQDDGKIDSGYSVMGTFVTIGSYAKYTITDKLWLNYNPVWYSTLTGSEDTYKDNAYGPGEDSLLTHEATISYQFTPRFNVRLFANWNENVDFSNGDHRLEFNYQL